MEEKLIYSRVYTKVPKTRPRSIPRKVCPPFSGFIELLLLNNLLRMHNHEPSELYGKPSGKYYKLLFVLVTWHLTRLRIVPMKLEVLAVVWLTIVLRPSVHLSTPLAEVSLPLAGTTMEFGDVSVVFNRLWHCANRQTRVLSSFNNSSRYNEQHAKPSELGQADCSFVQWLLPTAQILLGSRRKFDNLLVNYFILIVCFARLCLTLRYVVSYSSHICLLMYLCFCI